MAWRRIEGEIVVVDLRNSEYFALTDSAQVLWDRLAEGASVIELAGLLVGEYDIALELAEKDVATLVDDLLARGVVMRA